MKRSFGNLYLALVAQVERVHDAAGGRDAEVALQVRVVVPAQRRDPVALLQAQLLQR